VYAILVFFLSIVVAFTTFVTGLLAAPFDLKVVPPAPKSVLLLAEDGTQFGLIRPSERREIISPEDIPDVMRQAIISAEDARFLDHKGVDPLATARAAYLDLTAGERKGASTITQQYVKYAYVGNERTLLRKVREAGLAVRLESRKSKEEILTDYLNVIFLGNSTYGVQAASKYYYDVPVTDLARDPSRPGSSDDKILALARASMLAGIAPAPSDWNPVANFDLARDRQKYTLNQMVLNGYITTAEASAAFQREEAVVPKRALEAEPPSTAPEYADLVKAQLKAAYKDDPDKLDRGGFRVTTALDTDLQEAMTRAVREVLPDPTDPQAAVVAVDINTGDVKAMTTLRRFPAKVGRKAIDGYERGGFNLATNANRSTGSTIKPFTLATALQEGLQLDTRRPAPGCDNIPDPTAPDGVYRYCNAGGETSPSRGSLTLQSALQRSVNTVYVPLAIEVGRPKIKQLMLDSGVVADEDAFGTAQKSFGLGTTALVTPLSMANGFGTLVNGGKAMTPRFVLETRDVDGTVLEKAPAKPAPARQAMSADVANRVAEAMSGVTAPAGTAPVAKQDYPVFGKTGTTNDSTGTAERVHRDLDGLRGPEL
jgi:penicillin-binding protein 1A